MRALIKHCKKCLKETKHRPVIDTRGEYYRCSICAENASKRHRKSNWYKYLAQKANSRKRANSEKLSGEQIEEIAKYQEFKCALTGVPFDINSKWWKPSLDRIDSSSGYTCQNIRLVAWIVNHTRGSLTDKEFINMCNKVASNYHKYPYSESCVLEDLG